MKFTLCRRLRSFGASLGPFAPVNTIPPSVSGVLEVGEVLTSSTGTWTGTGVISYTYQWRRNGISVPGETSSTYTILELDEGAILSCRVTATDDVGSKGANSNNVIIPGDAVGAFSSAFNSAFNVAA